MCALLFIASAAAQPKALPADVFVQEQDENLNGTGGTRPDRPATGKRRQPRRGKTGRGKRPPKALRTDLFEQELVHTLDALDPHGVGTYPHRLAKRGRSDRRKLPWTPRRRTGVVVSQVRGEPLYPGALSGVRLKALGLRGGPRSRVSAKRWPPEPKAPDAIDRTRLVKAAARLCPHRTSRKVVEALTTGALEAAEAFDVDPFLLIALAYQQSRCGTVKPDTWGLGMTRLNMGMHRRRVHPNGYYAYQRWDGKSRFVPAQLPIHRYQFTRYRVEKTISNLYFAAAFLKVFSHQCPASDRAFGSVPHRHPISHMVWGDEVRSALPEDLIMTARRRLLGYYRASTRPPRAVYRHLVFSSPLDGAPRVVIGIMGDPRESGRRRHAGIDFLSTYGEPVRAMAPGTVAFAGIDSRKRGFLPLTPEQATASEQARMGPRGLFVRLDHGGEVSTLYVHLAEYLVKNGQQVNRGDVIGYVGRTGMHTSDAHLHLGLFDRGVPVDPLPHLQPLLVTADGIPTVDLRRLHKALSNAHGRP